MKYLLKYESLSHICNHQYIELISSFDSYDKVDEGILLPFTDKNYCCMDKYDEIVNSKIHALSFFSGCGGLDLGFTGGFTFRGQFYDRLNTEILFANDFDQDAQSCYNANPLLTNNGANCLLADIRNVKGIDYDGIIKSNNPEKLIIVGGPPCQPFSKAGYWITNNKRKGADDERNMIAEYLRIIDEIRPDGFLLENVESILHPTNRIVIDYIEEETTRMGYNFQRILANATEFGIPQKRKRVIFVASKLPFTGELIKLSPEETQKVKVLDWIGRFDIDELSETEEVTTGKTYDLELKEIPPGHNYIALSARDGYPNPKFVANKRFWNFLLKLHPLLPSWTIAAQPGPWVGPFHWNNRRLRVKEIAAIQTFPMDYQFIGNRRTIQKQIGNAVPSLLGKAFVDLLKTGL